MFKVPNYTFGGDPVSQAAAAKTAAEHLKAAGQVQSAQAAARGQVGAAQQGALGQLYQQPGNIYGAGTAGGSQAMQGYSAGMAGMGRALADLYGSYGNSLASLQSNLASSMGQTEAARQIGLANLGSAGLSSMGQMMGGAFGAQAQNQSAAYKSMADMLAANQQAMSSYGASRDSALAGLGNSAATLGGTGANAYSQLGAGLANARASAAGALGSAYGNAIGSLGQSASQLGAGLANANAGLYGTLGTAAGNLGSSGNSALAGIYTAGSNNNLGAYNTAARYSADMARLGLARDLGFGQIGVAGNAFGASDPGGVSMTASGAPLGASYGSGYYGSSPYSAIQGSPPPPAWYQEPQSLPAFSDPAMTQGGSAIAGNMRGTLGALGGMSSAGGRGIGSAGSQAYSQLGALQGLSQRIPDLYRPDEQSAYSGINASLGQGYAGLQGARNDLNNSPIASYLLDNAAAGRRRLNQSMNTNNQMLTDWLNTGLGSMAGMLGSSYGQLNSGMNQFYGNIPRDGSYLLGNALRQGASELGSMSNRLGSSLSDFNRTSQQNQATAYKQLNDLMNRAGLMTPIERMKMQFNMDDLNAQRQRELMERRKAGAG